MASIAIPQYSSYTSRAKATGAVAEISSTKTAIALCQADLGTFTGCNAGSNGVPTIAVTKNITAVTSVTNGVISVTTGATDTASPAVNFTIIDTPTLPVGGANMLWTNTGTVCDGGVRGLKAGQGDCP